MKTITPIIIPEITMSKELFGEDKGILNLENDADFNLYGFHGCGIYVNEGKGWEFKI